MIWSFFELLCFYVELNAGRYLPKLLAFKSNIADCRTTGGRQGRLGGPFWKIKFLRNEDLYQAI